ncbi:tRNA-uridine aminocarboxypropyltransferase 2 isoform X2 [Mobula birostris]|uniref:tRNA-uridine aminocarboxypropyltransferase 2 isoform X2 n=1 Tax=Mobula birostris TaxID=1983395 RepID=UPI003B28CB17
MRPLMVTIPYCRQCDLTRRTLCRAPDLLLCLLVRDEPSLLVNMEPERARGEAAADSEGGRSSAVCAEEEQNVLQELSELPVEGAGKRPTCSRCSRPQKVCLCPFLPVHPLNVSTCLYIVQHPAEESRVLRTVPLLAACLPADKCKVFIGRRFNEDRHPELAAVCQSISTLVLYPGPEANNLEELELDPSLSPYNIIIIDGTWSQAKTMFYGNALFRLPKQASLTPGPTPSPVLSGVYDLSFLASSLSTFRRTKDPDHLGVRQTAQENTHLRGRLTSKHPLSLAITQTLLLQKDHYVSSSFIDVN